MPECGIEGWARVLGIGKCPQISPRPGPEFQLVTATFKHHAKQILDVHIAGEKDAIGTTPNHPFWSQNKHRFIRADELTPGEHVQKANGTLTTITKIVPRPDANTVFNLEVQLNHTYHVGTNGVLVHNGTPCQKVLAGQIHHPISTKVSRELERHPILKGAFKKRDSQYVTQALDSDAHRGYQRWHRDLDDEVVNWIRENKKATTDDFLGYLRNLYKRPDLAKRFPNGF